jgi:hypothetical protein
MRLKLASLTQQLRWLLRCSHYKACLLLLLLLLLLLHQHRCRPQQQQQQQLLLRRLLEGQAQAQSRRLWC